MDHLVNYLHNAAYLVIALALIWLATVLERFTMPRVDLTASIARGNVAAGLRRAGVTCGLGLALVGYLTSGGTKPDLVADLTVFALDGLCMVAMLLFSVFINEKWLLPTIDNDRAVASGNVSVGIVEFGSSVATGLIAWGSFSGEGGGLASTVVFFVLGQVVLVIASHLYEYFTPYVLFDELQRDNRSAAVMLAGNLVCLGVILRAAIAGDFVDWATDLTAFGTAMLAGYLTLMLVDYVTDKVLMRGKGIHAVVSADRNAAAALKASGIKLAAALVIGATAI